MQLPPECGWRNTHEFSKYPVQVRCIAEPYRERHVAKRESGFGQQSSCTAGPLRQDVLVGRKPNCVLECPDEVVVAQSRQGRQIRYRNFIRDLSVDKLRQPPYLTCGQTSPNRVQMRMPWVSGVP